MLKSVLVKSDMLFTICLLFNSKDLHLLTHNLWLGICAFFE